MTLQDIKAELERIGFSVSEVHDIFGWTLSVYDENDVHICFYFNGSGILINIGTVKNV